MYKIKNNFIYYNEKKLKNLNLDSFEILSEFIAKDKNQLLYKGNVVKENIDIASFKVLNEYYAKDTAKVFYQTQTKLKHLKSAKSSAFTILDENFARSMNTFFLNDKRITIKNKENLQILAKNIAIDGEYIYIESYKEKLAKGLDLSKIKFIENTQISENKIVILDKNVYFLRSNYSEIMIIKNIDSETFEFLNQYYAKDKNNFYYQQYIVEKNRGQKIVCDSYTIALGDKYYIGDKFIGNEKLIDIDNYFLDNNYIYDDLGNILEKRETIDLKSITEKDTILAIKKSIELFFYIYDNNYTNLSYLQELENYSGSYHEIPKYSIKLEKNLINIHYDNKVFSGYISTFTSLFSKFWCYCRDYQVDNKSFVKFISYIGHNDGGYLNLTKNMYEHNYQNFIILTSYLYKNKYLDEVQIICENFFQVKQDYILKILTITPIELLNHYNTNKSTEHISFAYKSTYLASAKNIISLIQSESNIHKRYKYAKGICEMILGTGNLKGFAKPVLTKLMQIAQDEKNNAVKEFLYLALEIASTLSSYKLDWQLDEDTMYWSEQSYKLSKFLVEQGINLDVNYTRLWITQHLFDDKGIEKSNKALSQLMQLDCPAPAIYTNSGAFASFKVLRIYYSLRLALIADIDIAKKILKNSYKAIDKLRFDYNYHSMQTSLVLIQTKMIEVAKRHKIPLPFDDYTNKDSYSGYSNMMKTIKSTKFNLKKIAIIQSGLYEEQHILKKLDYKLVDTSKQLKIKLFDKIGIDYLLDGEPWNRQIATKIKVTHPPLKNTKESITTFDSVSVIGMRNSFYWNFEDENELVSGKWSIEINFVENGLKLKPLFVKFDIKV